MKNAFGLAVTVAVVFLVSAALAGATPAARSAAVTTARTGLGRVVADGSGRTLYLFEKDTATRSACSGTCAVYWPPLLTEAVRWWSRECSGHCSAPSSGPTAPAR